MGLLGFGDLAKHTARAAKTAFGMRIITVRRNAAKSHVRPRLQPASSLSHPLQRRTWAVRHSACRRPHVSCRGG
jgi:phosphoglycerate dehydrogenase-like enzyme